jgi:uncharacterized Fe-S cluster-containing radical SAM superfamily protein
VQEARNPARKNSEKKTNMYASAKTWNPFKGCRFACTYCVPSFQQQAKRQMHRCQQCYDYVPHTHEERLSKIPSAEIVFVCGNGDISACPLPYARRIVEQVVKHSERCPRKTFYFQSKRPKYFEPLLGMLPESAILITTLETNRDEGYKKVSKAPPPSERYRQFKALDYPRKVVTVEPVMEFDLETFAGWLIDLKPEFVYLGFNSKKSVKLPEPSEQKMQDLAKRLTAAGVLIRGKDLRGMQLPTI